MHAAIVSGIRKSVEKLIDHGADVNARDNKGNTPLHMLRMMKNSEEIKESVGLPELSRVSPIYSLARQSFPCNSEGK